MSEYVSLVNLPSKYLIYEGLNPGDIKVRSLKGRDEKLIAEINSSNIEIKFCQLLDNVLEGISARKLTLGDRMFILLYLSIDTYGKDWPVEYICEHCLQKNFQDIDINAFDSKTLDLGFKQPYPVELSDKVVYLRLFTVDDEIKIAEQELRTGDVSIIYKYALSIVDNEKSIEDKVKMLEDTPLRDFNKIKAFHAKFEHGPLMVSPYTCRHCGGEGRVPVPFRTEMVFRSGQDLANIYGENL